MPQKLMPWYQFTREELNQHLHTDFENGLASEEVVKRAKRYGKNTFTKKRRKNLLDRVAEQVKNPLVLILLAAGIATIFLHEYADAIVIFIALLINVGIGVVQERRASNAFEKLSSSQEKSATVIRDGHKKVIPAEDLVPGDIIDVEEGMYIPADARILEEKELAINESALTGEWVEVGKDASQIDSEAPITEQENMAWMGTLVTAGDARAVIVGTGDNTQIGAIAQSLIDSEETKTPLQKSIAHLARTLVYVILAILVIIFGIGLFHGHTLVEMVLISIAVAVAAMPQGLPAAVTVVLALGMESILKKNGLVRNLLAAETLGSTTTILTDKTGTLTEAEMRVAEVITMQSIEEENTEDVKEKGAEVVDTRDEVAVLKMAMMNSDAFVEGHDEALAQWIVRGKPVERAIMLAGLESGLEEKNILKADEQLDFLPFSSERRFAASLYSMQKRKRRRMFVTGAPEYLLERATSVYRNGKTKKISKTEREALERTQNAQSELGMRLIGVAYKDVPEDTIPEEIRSTEEDSDVGSLVFCGFVVLHDPMREDVPEAIKTAQEAGTQVIMVTGDNAATAATIAQKAGIITERGDVLTGPDIDALEDDELFDAVKSHRVIARVLPRQKLRIAKLFRDKEEVVAMTGDGVNDAPALRNADIGIALGSGTEVAKEASDLILLNNSFAIIVMAIEEGRRILDNLKKVVAYLLSTSFSEIALVGAALIAGTPIPLLPTQILWTNIIEEGFMNFAFAFEPKEKGVMKRNPRDIHMKRILTKELKQLIILIASVTGVLLVALYAYLVWADVPEKELRTIMFIGISIDSIFFAYSIKNLRQPIWNINLLSNKYLTFSLFGSLAALVIALITPPLQSLLSLAPPTTGIFLLMVVLGIVNLLIIETIKYFIFERKAKKAAVTSDTVSV